MVQPDPHPVGEERAPTQGEGAETEARSPLDEEAATREQGIEFRRRVPYSSWHVRETAGAMRGPDRFTQPAKGR